MLSDLWESGEFQEVSPEGRQRRGHEVLARACGVAVVAIGVVGFAGWASGVLALAGATDAWIPAAPSTLLLILLVGIALIGNASSQPGRVAGNVRWLAVPVIVTAVVVLVRSAGELRVALTSGEAAALAGGIPLGRMSPLTASGLALAAFAIVLGRPGRHALTDRIGGALGAVAFAVGVVTAHGYVHGAPLLYGGRIIPVSAPAALALVLLGLGQFALSAPAVAPLRAFLGETVRARLLRGFVPSMALIVLLMEIADTMLAKAAAPLPTVWRAVVALLSLSAIAGIAAALARRIGGDIDRAATERRRAEAKVVRLAQALESVAESVVIANLDNTTAYVNEAFVRAYGYDREQLLGTDIAFVRSLKTPPGLGAEILAATRAGGWRGEVWQRRKDGSEFLVALSTSLVRDDDGRAVALVSVARDITEIKRAELALRASEERFRLLVEHLGEGVAVVDNDGRFVLANPAAESILGVAPRAMVGRNLLDFVAPEQHSMVAAERGRRADTEMSRYEVDGVRPDGAHRRLEITATPFPGADGVPGGTINVLRDVTAERQLEQTLRHAQKMEAVGRLAAGIAHDFNNLLQSMANLTQLLAADSGDPLRARAVAAELSQEVRRGAGLARQLLLFSRQAATKRERLDLNSVVAGAEPLLRRIVPENVKLALEPASVALTVEADGNQLEQVLLNLAANGADVMPDGGTLAIRTGAEGATVWLEVKDGGPGVPEEIRDRIFEPFFTTKGAEKGTGLGLAVVHGIVQEHGGRIELATAPGAGATFRVVLPRVVTPHQEAAPRSSSVALPDGGRGERILVVEDEDAARASLAEVLAMLGYAVTAVASAEEAENLQAATPYDLLLTDFRLPGASGADLASELRAKWPHLAIILMSGYTEDRAVREGVNAGEVRFLQKPFDMTTLARELRAALAAR